MDFCRRKGEYTCYGSFCSIPCMKTYNLELNDSHRNIRFTYIHQLYAHLYDDVSSVAFAPHRDELRVFGGTFGIDDFRQTIKPHTHRLVPPMTVLKNQQDTHDSYMVSAVRHTPTANIQIQNEPLRLQRTNPIRSNQNTLEMSMGIFKS